MFRPKISGIRGITLVSVLHWSKSMNSTNPRWPPDAILNYKKAFIENDRESSVLDSLHLQANFLKKISFLEFFSISKCNAPGLHVWYTVLRHMRKIWIGPQVFEVRYMWIYCHHWVFAPTDYLTNPIIAIIGLLYQTFVLWIDSR